MTNDGSNALAANSGSLLSRIKRLAEATSHPGCSIVDVFATFAVLLVAGILIVAIANKTVSANQQQETTDTSHETADKSVDPVNRAQKELMSAYARATEEYREILDLPDTTSEKFDNVKSLLLHRIKIGTLDSLLQDLRDGLVVCRLSKSRFEKLDVGTATEDQIVRFLEEQGVHRTGPNGTGAYAINLVGNKIVELERRKQELLEQYGEKHPDVVLLGGQIAEWNSSNILAGLTIRDSQTPTEILRQYEISLDRTILRTEARILLLSEEFKHHFARARTLEAKVSRLQKKQEEIDLIKGWLDDINSRIDLASKTLTFESDEESSSYQQSTEENDGYELSSPARWIEQYRKAIDDYSEIRRLKNTIQIFANDQAVSTLVQVRTRKLSHRISRFNKSILITRADRSLLESMLEESEPGPAAAAVLAWLNEMEGRTKVDMPSGLSPEELVIRYKYALDRELRNNIARLDVANEDFKACFQLAKEIEVVDSQLSKKQKEIDLICERGTRALKQQGEESADVIIRYDRTSGKLFFSGDPDDLATVQELLKKVLEERASKKKAGEKD